MHPPTAAELTVLPQIHLRMHHSNQTSTHNKHSHVAKKKKRGWGWGGSEMLSTSLLSLLLSSSFILQLLCCSRRRCALARVAHCLIRAANSRSAEECSAPPPPQGAARPFCVPQACSYSQGAMWGARPSTACHKENEPRRGQAWQSAGGGDATAAAHLKCVCCTVPSCGWVTCDSRLN